jgi:hypothetical protein
MASRTAPRPWYHKRWVWLLAGLAVVVIGVRLALNPVADHFVRRWLNQFPTLGGDYQGLSISVFPPALELRDFSLYEKPRVGEEPPLLQAERVRGRLDVGRLLRGDVAVRARVDRPKLSYVIRKPVEREVKETAQRLEEPAKELLRLVRALPPHTTERVELRDGELLIVDAREKGSPSVHVHGLEATLENLPTSAKLSGGLPTLFAASGTVEESGKLSLFLTLDTFQEQPTFAGRMRLSGQQLNDFNDLARAKADVVIPKGTMDLSAVFVAREGRIRGSLKPVLKGADFKAADDDLGSKLKAALGDVALSLTEDQRPGEDKLATVVPINGRLQGPGIGLGSAVVGVLRNAFVEGIASGFTGMRPGRGVGGAGREGEDDKKDEKKKDEKKKDEKKKDEKKKDAKKDKED